MKLIITEKPSVAKDIAKAINAITSGDGFIKNSEYTITWAFGHLLKLDPKLMPEGNWSFDNLPVFPANFNYVTSASTSKQFKIIKNLLLDAKSVVIATDAGREGELIGRLILNQANWKNWESTYRLWSSEALTEAVVLKCLSNLQPSKKFDSLYYSALTRQHSDWLCGINLTQAVTLQSKSNGVWSIGRVQTPSLSLIVNRDLLRKGFKPEEYFILKAIFSIGNAKYEGFYTNSINSINDIDTETEEEEGEKLSKLSATKIIDDLYSVRNGVVLSVIKEKKQEVPPLLHSLTSLQREANTSFGLSAQKTLDIAQELYEKHKILSYPRTDSQHMAESSKEIVIKSLENLNRAILIPKVEQVGKKVFNDSKLTDHHAIIPLAPPPNSLNKDELNVFNLVLRKFIGAFMPNYEFETTTILTNLKNYSFKTNGKVNIDLGWKSLYNSDVKKDDLPQLKEGLEVIKENLNAIQKFTKPAAAFTEASLLAIMERLNLGTPATRADIIEKLIEREYLFREKKNLLATAKGIELITKSKGRKFIEPELTAQWELKLDELCKQNLGLNGYNEFITNIKNFVSEELISIKSMDLKVNTEVGKCACGKPITESFKAFNCLCGKLVWKEAFKKKISPKQAEALMNNKVVELKGCTGIKGKFDAKVKLGNENKLEFVK